MAKRAFVATFGITEDFQLTPNEPENQSRKKLFFTGCKCKKYKRGVLYSFVELKLIMASFPL